MKYINPYKQFHGSFVPEWLMEREEISPGAKLCYARLARFAGKDGHCFPKRDKIAKGIGVSDRQVGRYISELCNYNLIEYKKMGLGKPNEYRFLLHEWMDNVLTDRTDVSSPIRTDMSSLDRTDMSSHIRESLQESQVYNNTIHHFDEFWDLYDKKVERKKCERKWKKLSKDDIESILQFVPIYKESVSSKQYQKNPFTFLNSRIWEDEWDNYKPKANEAYQQFSEKQPSRTDYFSERGRELIEYAEQVRRNPDRYNTWQLEGKRTDPYSTG